MTLLVTGDSGGPAPHWRRPRRARLAALASLLLGADPAWPQSLDNYQVAGSVAAYLGVVPSEIVQGHPLSHPEGRMHGGAPGGHRIGLGQSLSPRAGGRPEFMLLKGHAAGLHAPSGSAQRPCPSHAGLAQTASDRVASGSDKNR